MIIKYYFTLISIPLLLSISVFSQTSGWTIKDPFNRSVFIENKGQFDPPAGKAGGKNGNDSSKVLFGVSREGIALYFSAKGLMYKHDELMPMTEEEETEKTEYTQMSNEDGEKKRQGMKSIPRYLSLEWMGSNLNTEIIAEELVSFYYTYSGEGKYAGSTIKANVYKKIIYKNLYENIDLEYIFPSDSTGIKYSLILRPGANPADIKMKYEDASAISLDSDGNVVIKSSFGEFIDHAPVSFYANGEKIPAAFALSDNIVSFKLETLNLKHKTIIIDPWITNPTFTGFNSAYDVNYDLNGNVYVYGSYDPFKLIKLNSVGAIQWIFNATGLGWTGSYHYYGDFTVDEVSGTSYIVEGFGATSATKGARVFKVNTLGIQTGTYPGDPKRNEMWRAEYNRCINKIVIGAGGTNSASGGGIYGADVLDTDMVNITPVNVLSTALPVHDMALLAIDNNSNFCYMATAKPAVLGPSGASSTLIKCPIPNLLPLVFSVPSGHRFWETGNVTYINNGSFGLANGMNGMAISPGWLYTYDSDSLKRWNKNTGALVNKIDVSPLPPTYGYPLSGNKAIQVSWGGLSADECDNVYAGMGTSIKEYNTSLALINTFALPDTVYDVKMGPNSKLYACGKGFVTQIDVVPNNTTVTVTPTPASCNTCDGTASAIISCGNPSGFNYSWNTSPIQTTQMATGLCAGNYTVTLITNCFIRFTGTVTITGSSGILSTTVTAVPATCNNNNGSATVNVSGGASPYTFSWLPAGGTNAAITGLTAGTYTLLIKDANGCTYTSPVVITAANPPVAAAWNDVTITSGSSTTLAASGGGTYLWSNGSTGSMITVTPAGTTRYCVTVTDADGCTDDACVTVTVEQINCVNEKLYLPNVFSPNDDGENDVFKLFYGNALCIKDMRLVLYDRWGSPVFETTNPAFVWDGTGKNRVMNTSVFVYNFDATLITGEEITKKGNISLLR